MRNEGTEQIIDYSKTLNDNEVYWEEFLGNTDNK